MELHHDAEADAVHNQLSSDKYAFGEDLNAERRIDYSAGGKPIGIELVCVSTGVDLRNLPEQDAITKLLSKHRIKVLAS